MPDETVASTLPDERFEQALAELLQAEECGKPLDLSRVLATAPELESRLREFFRDRHGFDRLAPHLAPSPVPVSAPAPQDLLPGSRLGGYEILEEVDRGGRGIVYRVSDLELNRPLAVKVLRAELHDEPDAVRRFLEEAQVTGQLQHPGIVPVHAIGQLPDGRPYFAMKLVQGRNLAQLLAERPAPGHDWPRFLGIFQQVCQALAYAHSRGVLHRDLKPANVMVGAFAEVQVMDWGLAKVLDRPSPVPERGEVSAIRTVRTEATGLSSADGLVVGTFAFMPPEQAKGEVEQLDARADVFGLGAVLCEVLTGLPPYTGVPAWKLHLLAASGDLADAFTRLERCGADAELIALAKECLAPERERRPHDAGAVAERVAAHLAGVQARLRRAELEQAAAEARAAGARATVRAERRARRLTVGLAAAGLLLLGAGGSGAWWWQQRRQRTDGEVTLALSDARRLLEQAKGAPLGDGGRFREALAAAHKAFGLAKPGEASPELREQAADLVADLGREAAAAQRDRGLLAQLLETAGPQEGPNLTSGNKAQLRQLAGPNRDEEFASAFRAWGLDVDATPTAEAAARLKARPAAVVTEVVAALDAWMGERQLRKKPSAAWQRLADLAVALDDRPDSKRRELRALLVRNRLPGERTLGELSRALLPLAALTGVVPGEDRNRLRRLAATTDAGAEPVLGLLVLVRALALAGDEARAEQLLQTAVRVRPGEVVLHQALGRVLETQRPPRWAEAVECYAAARALRPELGSALADALVNSGRVDQGLALSKHLVAESPDNPWLHLRRGNALGGLKRLREGEAEFRAAIHLKPDFPEAHYNLGVALFGQDRFKEAEAAYREASRLKPEDHKARSNLALALLNQGRPKEAEAELRAAIRLKPDDPVVHSNLGEALNTLGRYQEAEAACREAIALEPGFPDVYVNLGRALSHQHRSKEAEAASRMAIRLKPDEPAAHYNLGTDLLDQRRYREAEAELRETIRLKPDHYKAHSNLANALSYQGRYQEAEAACRAALHLKPDDYKTHSNLGNVLVYQGRHEEAEAAYREAIRLKPDDYKAYYNLGNVLQGNGRFREAQARYREVLRLVPPGEPIRRAVEGLIRQCERLVELDGRLLALRRGGTEPANATECLELAALCGQPYKGLYALAARFYAASFAADPKLADDIRMSHRYQAAQCAVVAAAGQGTDSPKPGDKERARLRSQALGWLSADLGLCDKLAETGKAEGRALARRVLWVWQSSPSLASVRDKEGLTLLPEPERKAWKKFWADVEVLRKQLPETK